MKNKIICLLLALMMVFGMLVSCGDEPSCTHRDADDDSLCDNCGESFDDGKEPDDPTPGPGGDDPTPGPGDVLESPYDWDLTELIFQMNSHSHNGELTSGCKRYLAGEDEDAVDTLDIEIMTRNSNAEIYANVNVTYEYWKEGDPSYDWGKTIDVITNTVKTNADGAPDIYCSFLYDMMSTSLQNSFHNLRSTKKDNYFEFMDEDYDESVDDRGYMMEFMHSLTLSGKTMLILGSDYFIDTVRAFFIVPANVAMLATISPADPDAPDYDPHAYNADRNEDGKFDVEDFIELIWDRDWTYDAIIGFASQITDDCDGVTGDSVNDVLCFGLENKSGFTASGILYTSSIKIINRELKDNVLTYQYPETNPDLYDLERRLTTLLRTNGVFTSTDWTTDTGAATNLAAIRSKFIGNTLMFGGFIMTGNLELEDFQNMRNNSAGGFCIAPGPLYRPISEDEMEVGADGEIVYKRDYQTQIHNVGRVGGVSRKTAYFPQCSAFLNYQSTHSTEILDTYYEEKLTLLAAGTENGNDDVMRFIRAHVRSAFDKAFEDSIGFYFESQDEKAGEKKWHSCMGKNGFEPDGHVASVYEQYAAEKQTRLEILEAFYEEFDQ